MIPPIFATLSNDATVTAIIGSGNACKCYPFGYAPQGTSVPYVSWLTVSGTPENKLLGGSFCDVMRVQVDCWSNSGTQALALAEAVRTSIESIGYMVSLNPVDKDTETKLIRYSMDFELIVNR